MKLTTQHVLYQQYQKKSCSQLHCQQVLIQISLEKINLIPYIRLHGEARDLEDIQQCLLGRCRAPGHFTRNLAENPRRTPVCDLGVFLGLRGFGVWVEGVQGYLAHKKPLPTPGPP